MAMTADKHFFVNGQQATKAMMWGGHMSEHLNIIFSTMFQVFQKKTDSAHQISHIDYMHVSWEMVSDRDGPGHSFVMFVILFKDKERLLTSHPLDRQRQALKTRHHRINWLKFSSIRAISFPQPKEVCMSHFSLIFIFSDIVSYSDVHMLFISFLLCSHTCLTSSALA